MLVARWVSAAEQNLSELIAGNRWGVSRPGALAYLDRLVEGGYELFEAEQQLYADLQPADVNTAANAEDTEDTDDEEGEQDAEE